MKAFKFLHFSVGLIALTIIMGGCSKKNVKPDDGGDSGSVSESTIASGANDSDSGNALGLKTVHFPYDSSDISGTAKEEIAHNIKILNSNAALKVQIEGHCDDRGGIQYNLALGERRAAALKNALVASGINKSRLTTISFGKEKPVVQGSSEEAWAQNRRGNFVITEK